MVYKKEEYKSGEYSPTPSHALPAFKGGEPRGFVCQHCGHMELDEDEVFGLTCKKCFRAWCEKNISQMSSIKEIIRQEQENTVALDKTAVEKKKIESEKKAKEEITRKQQATTAIISKDQEAVKKPIVPPVSPPIAYPVPPPKKSWVKTIVDIGRRKN